MHALQTRKLHKVYGHGDTAVHALRGVGFDIPKGQFVSVMGPSGSGKSTLLHLVGLLDAPTRGGIRILGRNVSRLSVNQRALARRQALGFVFQSFHLMPRVSALHNVMLPMAIAGVPRSKRAPRARAILKAVGLEGRTDHKPNELSGGQKQRVAIARSLALDPPILLADEPTGNLDSSTSKDVMELFTRLNQSGRTIIQVTHDRHMAQYGQRILHFKDGRILQDERVGGGA